MACIRGEELQGSIVLGSTTVVPNSQKCIDSRPPDCKLHEIFLGFRDGKCINQPMGINTIGSVPKKIAAYLQLPDAKAYTGHALRRTSATIYANAGGTVLGLKDLGAWNSPGVAESYVGQSRFNKLNTSTLITNAVMGTAHAEAPRSDDDGNFDNDPKQTPIPPRKDAAVAANPIPSLANMDVDESFSDAIDPSPPIAEPVVRTVFAEIHRPDENYNVDNCPEQTQKIPQKNPQVTSKPKAPLSKGVKLQSPPNSTTHAPHFRTFPTSRETIIDNNGNINACEESRDITIGDKENINTSEVLKELAGQKHVTLNFNNCSNLTININK